ncbi:MAG: hypothetical protein LKE64_04650 [Solobacterium sp.]|jgi:hypothetical protein|nr:hypothetical protein [Solobacterium sp.]MCH4049273.1 hypothetical protein [Solobacterium sp.]MCH4075129.1 hypothetical protein [Solobacterium sp.]MCI1313518.1 hypothetical protein [Solobacterium sp.]MCI1345856.1 hypothetical protein [Solobacterium sp.]
MKKVLRIILFIVIAIALFFVYSIIKPVVPHHYESGKTGGELEKKYLAHGSHAVTHISVKAMQNFHSYEIYYPSDLPSSHTSCPVIVVSNGTGVKAKKASRMFAHFASWGFITIGTEEEYSWNGFSSHMALQYLLKENSDTNSIFYQKINTDAIGALGHSQGGVGVFNAVTVMPDASLYKTAVAESPTAMDLSDALEWHYDPSLVKILTFILSSTGSTDENTVIPLKSLQKLYDAIPDDVEKIMVRRKDADHGNMLYCADGYVTAWFLYQLCGDKEAASIFARTDELSSNPLYTDLKIR